MGKRMAASGLYDSWHSSWKSCVKVTKGGREMNVSMSGWGMSDQDMGRWCTWFREHMAKIGLGQDEWVTAKEVNFSKNQLTAIGTRQLLETLTVCRLSVHVLKLHYNRLSSNGGIVEFIKNCDGGLREVHLSHNDLDAQASAEIILAAFSATGQNGEYCYPMQSGPRGAAPLWLRLERNRVDVGKLEEIIQPAFAQLRRPGRALCNASSKACTPHCCSRYRLAIPAVHAKCLRNQRSWNAAAAGPAFEVDVDAVEEAAADCSTAGPSTPSSAGKLNLLSGSASTAEQSPAQESGEAFGEHTEDGAYTRAKVWRWDQQVGQWVSDFIDIPLGSEHASGTSDTEEQLKQLIGADNAMQTPGMIGTGTLIHVPPYASGGTTCAEVCEAAAVGILALINGNQAKRSAKAAPKSKRASRLLGSQVKQAKHVTPDVPLPPPAPPPLQTRITSSNLAPVRPGLQEDSDQPVQVNCMATTFVSPFSFGSTVQLNPDAEIFVPCGFSHGASSSSHQYWSPVLAEQPQPVPKIVSTSPFRTTQIDGCGATVILSTPGSSAAGSVHAVRAKENLDANQSLDTRQALDAFQNLDANMIKRQESQPPFPLQEQPDPCLQSPPQPSLEHQEVRCLPTSVEQQEPLLEPTPRNEDDHSVPLGTATGGSEREAPGPRQEAAKDTEGAQSQGLLAYLFGWLVF